MEIKCPYCKKEIHLTDSEASYVLSQVRDEEVRAQVDSALKQAAIEEEAKIEKMKAMSREEIAHLKALLSQADEKAAQAEKIARLESESEKQKMRNDMILEKEGYELLLSQAKAETEFYRDLKAKSSTKMIGETLEKHCETAFNQIRMAAFPNAYFEKDNEVSKSSHSKGDFIFREFDPETGVEIVSIMFEMKNEADETSTKHKNKDFFKELDKDRREKGCEYAVLVSLLESDSELYNAGIVDVSYEYEKMYVIRPQCFIPIITLLRNAALNALHYKKELEIAKSKQSDLSRFEENLEEFCSSFTRNYDLAHGHFSKAIEEIDRSIASLERVKESLTKSDKQYQIASKKVNDITIEKLTKNAPSIRKQLKP